ncbi:phosphoribosylaminoimidazolesuccinocarboxamide synthase [Patescibacteria group bacterium]|nr:phosphoribosylaminoimidazolesuccinocarboxamide synthase [Patescibacteria group bacterium]MBU1015962.1 phosphoribosylaminoimidazolesuccinocarboxamide synthase [Patescibacteria group bacterium]MBU1685310.1 phosphoribosylaminoimidazolesuccinocarboxamide synthase [Patescibacteria group bacterium]MBU1939097.1 phosphoribosylaminoimidazolesuccinocarboxamide synthase [Patescibacteria group bacterium]
MPNRELIKKNLKNTVTETNLQGYNKLHVGKVRDTYEKDGQRIIVTTDRQSAFDRILAAIPFKGAVLNQFAAFWFDKTKDIVTNHMIATPDPNVSIVKKVKIYPVEVVVRGYITGTTDTSAWMNYANGERNFCGVQLPEGLKKNQKFETPIITPTTKPETGHDEKISREGIIAQGLVPEDEWARIEKYALAIFKRGQEVAAEKGFILVDTKYEFGKDADGNIVLADEVHTPDSSRYWIAATYEDRFNAGQEPENFDKEFLRLWFKEHCDPYNDPELPPAPDDLVEELSFRYIDIYVKLTGNTFVYNEGKNIQERIQENLDKYFA